MDLLCCYCEKQFTIKSNLTRHLKNVHGVVSDEETKTVIEYHFDKHINKCLEGCAISFTNIVDLRIHLARVHKKQFNKESLNFNNIEEVNNWLSNISTKDCVQYFKQKTRRAEEWNTTYYYCNRSGKSRAICSSKRKRKSKSKGSCKFGGACTSTIQVRKANKCGKCHVTYIPTHYGHSIEPQHIRTRSLKNADIEQTLVEEYILLDKELFKDEGEETEPILLKSVCDNRTDPIRQQLQEQAFEIYNLDLDIIDDDIIQLAVHSQKNILNLLKSDCAIQNNMYTNHVSRVAKRKRPIKSTLSNKNVVNFILQEEQDIIQLPTELYVLRDECKEHNYAQL